MPQVGQGEKCRGLLVLPLDGPRVLRGFLEGFDFLQHLLDEPLMFRRRGQILRFVRVGLQIVKFVLVAMQKGLDGPFAVC